MEERYIDYTNRTFAERLQHVFERTSAEVAASRAASCPNERPAFEQRSVSVNGNAFRLIFFFPGVPDSADLDAAASDSLRDLRYIRATLADYFGPEYAEQGALVLSEPIEGSDETRPIAGKQEARLVVGALSLAVRHLLDLNTRPQGEFVAGLGAGDGPRSPGPDAAPPSASLRDAPLMSPLAHALLPFTAVALHFERPPPSRALALLEAMRGRRVAFTGQAIRQEPQPPADQATLRRQASLQASSSASSPGPLPSHFRGGVRYSMWSLESSLTYDTRPGEPLCSPSGALKACGQLLRAAWAEEAQMCMEAAKAMDLPPVWTSDRPPALSPLASGSSSRNPPRPQLSVAMTFRMPPRYQGAFLGAPVFTPESDDAEAAGAWDAPLPWKKWSDYVDPLGHVELGLMWRGIGAEGVVGGTWSPSTATECVLHFLPPVLGEDPPRDGSHDTALGYRRISSRAEWAAGANLRPRDRHLLRGPGTLSDAIASGLLGRGLAKVLSGPGNNEAGSNFIPKGTTVSDLASEEFWDRRLREPAPKVPPEAVVLDILRDTLFTGRGRPSRQAAAGDAMAAAEPSSVNTTPTAVRYRSRASLGGAARHPDAMDVDGGLEGDGEGDGDADESLLLPFHTPPESPPSALPPPPSPPRYAAPSDTLIHRLALHAAILGNLRATSLLWTRLCRELRLSYWDQVARLPGVFEHSGGSAGVTVTDNGFGRPPRGPAAAPTFAPGSVVDGLGRPLDQSDRPCYVDHSRPLVFQMLQLLDMCIERRQELGDRANYRRPTGAILGGTGLRSAASRDVAGEFPAAGRVPPITPAWILTPVVQAPGGLSSPLPADPEMETHDNPIYRGPLGVFSESSLRLLGNPSEPLRVPEVADPLSCTTSEAAFAAISMAGDAPRSSYPGGASAAAAGSGAEGQLDPVKARALQSDMSAFKAANPGCLFEDFVRWFSPRDYVEPPEGEAGPGSLSARMGTPGNVWQVLWKQAKAVPVRRQPGLLDPRLEGERLLHLLETMDPGELSAQLTWAAGEASLGVMEQTIASCLGRRPPKSLSDSDSDRDAAAASDSESEGGDAPMRGDAGPSVKGDAFHSTPARDLVPPRLSAQLVDLSASLDSILPAVCSRRMSDLQEVMDTMSSWVRRFSALEDAVVALGSLSLRLGSSLAPQALETLLWGPGDPTGSGTGPWGARPGGGIALSVTDPGLRAGLWTQLMEGVRQKNKGSRLNFGFGGGSKSTPAAAANANGVSDERTAQGRSQPGNEQVDKGTNRGAGGTGGEDPQATSAAAAPPAAQPPSPVPLDQAWEWRIKGHRCFVQWSSDSRLVLSNAQELRG